MIAAARTPRSPARRGAPGFSLIEGLLAALLLAAAAGSLVRSVAALSRAGRDSARLAVATRLARGQLDRLHAAPLTRGWLFPGPHPAVRPGGNVNPDAAPASGYVAWFDREGAAASRAAASWQVRWRIGDGAPAGADRLSTLRFDVLAFPAGGAPGPVVRLNSLRSSNGESP